MWYNVNKGWIDSMKKEVLAVKAPKSYLIAPLAFMIIGLLSGFSIIFFQNDHIFIKILCSAPLFVLGLFGVYLSFGYIFTPKIMLYYDEENIYLNQTKEIIPLSNIKYVEAECDSARFGVTYNYGHIIIVTQECQYKIGKIDEVEEVALRIQNIKK